MTPFRPGDIHANIRALQNDHNDQLNQMQQFLSIGKAALAADQFEDAQQNFTQLYTDIQDNLVPACLALRAYVYHRQQAHIRGLALADEYIARKRHNPDGYLLAGNMRLLSGDSEKALQVYRTGVQHSSHGHPRYPALVKQRDHVEQQINYTNTRLMRALSPEGIYATLALLKRKDLTALASTCRAWHKGVLGWPGMWREITITSVYDPLIGHPVQQLIEREPPQHLLKLLFRAGYIWSPKALGKITRYNRNNHVELDLYCYDTGDAHKYKERSYGAVSMLRNCKHTLKRLRLVYDHGQALSYSLENCRNLKRLIFENYQHSDDDHLVTMEAAINPLPPGPFSLRELFIQCDRTNLDIGALVSKCPQLEILRMIYNGSDLNNVLRALCNPCPQLQTLEIESAKYARLESCLSPPLRRRADPTQGLRKLTFNQDPAYAKKELMALIRNSRHSLEVLDVSGNPCVATFYKLLDGVQMDRLCVIRCGYTEVDSSFTPLKAIIDASSWLQDVYIPAGAASDVLLAALGRRSNLTELAFCVDEQLTSAGLDTLFSHTLSLQLVSLTYSGMQHGNISILQLFRAISYCKPLQQLEIRTHRWRDISDTEAQALIQHVELQRTNLQQVKIVTQACAPPEAIILLWANFKQLRYLNIINGPFRPSISWAECASIAARIRIPGLKIEFRRLNENQLYELDSNGNYYTGSNTGGDAAVKSLQ